MNVNLTPKLEEMIKQKIASGLYTSASEVVREALRLMEERDRIQAARLEEISQKKAFRPNDDGSEFWNTGQLDVVDDKTAPTRAGVRRP